MNHFIWADLSTYDPKSSIRFYKNVFQWKFENYQGYHIAKIENQEIIGIYETPDFFKKINMPHFWMSYIQVNNVEAIVKKVKDYSPAKVELQDDFYGGRIALIRDPQGAGFTIYDGNNFKGRSPGTCKMIWNELHVSDVDQIIPFYQDIFDWKIKKTSDGWKYVVLNSANQYIADVLHLTNEQKGKYEYWVCSFGVTDLSEARQKVIDSGGGVIVDEGARIMMFDDSQEAFFYLQEVNES